MEKKLTKNQKIDMLLALESVASNDMLVEFLNREKELNSKKSSSGSMSKTQKENVGLKEKIVNVLVEKNIAMTATAIGKEIILENGKEMSNQKASALLKQLVSENKVERIEDKKSVLFKAI